jgi:XTP/dITP diphosphohydrolase
VLVLSAAAAEDIVVEATCEGSIAEAPRGRGGFGYDPLFVVGDRRLSELPLDEKNRISHRGRALETMMPHLVELFGRRS